MKRKELDLESMIESVVEGLDNNQTLISDKPAIVAVQTKLKTNIAAVTDLKQKQAVSTKADYAIKGYRREEMTANLLVVGAGVAAVGAEKNDVRLKIIGTFTEPALNNMRESNLVVKGHEVYEAAMSIAPELLKWEVTQGEIDDLGDSTDSYLSQNPTIRNIEARSSRATAEIKARLHESYALIKDTLDPLMLPFKKINPTFYGEYEKTRIIISHAATRPKAGDKPAEVK
ncbi:MAG: hypothetical protein PHR83_01700 [Paludibacter sp.]|nr:hypothetical protein [Paludibacter sp.]